MLKYTITCTVSDAQDTELKAIATAIGITVPQLFQRFWDGYTSEGITMTGAVKSQIDQWLSDRLKTTLETMDTATALSLLK